MFKASFRHYLQLRGLVSQAGTLLSISSHGISHNGFFTCARNAIKQICFGSSTACMLSLQLTVSKEKHTLFQALNKVFLLIWFLNRRLW